MKTAVFAAAAVALALSSCAGRRDERVSLLLGLYEKELSAVCSVAVSGGAEAILDDHAIRAQRVIVDLADAGCRDTTELERLTNAYVFQAGLLRIRKSSNPDSLILDPPDETAIKAWLAQHKPKLAALAGRRAAK